MGRFLTVLLLALLVSEPPVRGWWPRGHSILSRAPARRGAGTQESRELRVAKRMCDLKTGFESVDRKRMDHKG